MLSSSARMAQVRPIAVAAPMAASPRTRVAAVRPHSGGAAPLLSMLAPLPRFGAVGAGRRFLACASASTDAPPAPAPPAEESFQYQAEVDRLMDIIVNSLYSNREVFLRELVSNASDALDKIRFVAVTEPDAMKGREELEIRISSDKEANTITIEDSGIGMTRDQLLSNLGTIARSGTRKFMELLKEKKSDSNLIGQFGVGFYSAFLVADRLVVTTKSHEDGKAWTWQSKAGSHEFTIKEAVDADLVRGTRVTLHLKEDATDLADPVRLSKLIKQYSQFIAFPIKLYSSKKEPKKVTDADATERKQASADKKAADKGEEVKPVEPVMKTEYDELWDWRVENENKPIWTRSPKEVSEVDYNDFFKATFSEFLEPLAHVHFNVEGTIEFSAILYTPGMAPFEQQNLNQRSKSIKLFVKRVFISDEFDEDLMPRYLNFIKGVVDSSDLPLNVSREILQESRIVRVIRKQLVRRSLEMIEQLSLAEDGEDYKTFWEAFGRNLKVGVIEDQDNREKLGKLLRFYSSRSDDKLTSLDQYISRIKPGQKSIYYMAGDTVAAASNAPFVEKLSKQGYEVLYLTEAIDEAAITNLGKFGDLELTDVSKEGLALDKDDDETAKAQGYEKEFAGVIDFLKATLGERIEKATVSNRLTDSPCALVTSKFGWSANMERIMRTQAMGDSRSLEYMRGRKILEINPEHDIVRGIKALLDEKDTDRARDLSELLFETSLITSGFQVESPRDYASKVFTLMKIALGYDVMPEGASESRAADAPGEAPLESVEADVVSEEDPWAKKAGRKGRPQ